VPRSNSQHRSILAACLLAALLVAVAFAPAARAAVPTPEEDPFYTYTGKTPLAKLAPGKVLKTRTLTWHVAGLPLPVAVVQLLYRTTGAAGEPKVNVTSVLLPPGRASAANVVAYQSFYDSLNPDDEPSYAISGGTTFGGGIPDFESGLFATELLSGNAIVIADTEGETADLAAGPEYGTDTLDSLRAALASPATGIPLTAKVAMIGYSGGAVATEWAAELAHTYARALSKRIVGASFGGVLADPAHNVHYIDGSLLWASIMPIALIGVSRAFHIDLTPYLSEYGLKLYNEQQKASITEVAGRYPGLTWAQLAKPEYATPESIPVYVETINKLIMGTRGTPTFPLLIGQGAGGELEGTSGSKPGIGPGDGVMIAGDVRTLAREYCERHLAVQYDQYDQLAHLEAATPWIASTVPWLTERFEGKPAPQDCSQIPAGNPLTPIP
jgi:hypothetical protein